MLGSFVLSNRSTDSDIVASQPQNGVSTARTSSSARETSSPRFVETSCFSSVKSAPCFRATWSKWLLS